MLFLAYRERKDKTPGKRKLDRKTFLREEGAQTVTSPITGEKIKLKSLTGPQYQEDSKSKDLLNKLFSEWRDKNKEQGDETPNAEVETPAPEEAPPKEAPPVEAPEVKAPPVEAPDVRAAPPTQEFSDQDMQEAYDPYVNTRDQAPPEPSREAPADQDEAPAAPDQDEAPAAPDQDEAPASPEVPEPDLGDSGPDTSTPEGAAEVRNKFKDFFSGMTKKDLSPDEIKAINDFDDWLRDLVGLEERDRGDKKKKEKPEKAAPSRPSAAPQLSLNEIPDAVTKAVKNKIKVSELPAFQAYADTQETLRKESEAPKADIRTKHHLTEEDAAAFDRLNRSIQKKHQSEMSKYNKAKRKYDREKAEADKATAEATQQHDALRSEAEQAGESKADVDSALKFSEQMRKREQSATKNWEKARDKAEADGEEPPPKPEPVDVHVEWLKDHKAQWEAQSESTRGEYKPPMVTREMFERIQKAPGIPTPPKPLADPPSPPSTKDIRRQIEESEPELADKLDSASDDEVGVLAAPTPSKSVAEMKAEFMDNTDDPDLKQRVMEMDPDEFGELLAAMNPTAKGKKGSLNPSRRRG